MVGKRAPGTGVREVVFLSDFVWNFSGNERTHLRGEGIDARTTLRTYRDAITGTTPFAPVLGPGVGVKSEVVFDGTPVEARGVTVTKHPYTLVGLFDPISVSAGVMPDEWVREWSATCSGMFTRTPIGEEVNSVGMCTVGSMDGMGGVEEAGPFPGVLPTHGQSPYPDTVTTGNTPPPPAVTRGRRVGVVERMIAPAPTDTSIPVPKVYPVCAQSAVLWDELAGYTTATKDTVLGVDNGVHSIPDHSSCLFVVLHFFFLG